MLLYCIFVLGKVAGIELKCWR